jgi:hypothetical protein
MATKGTPTLYDRILTSPDLNAEVKLHSKIPARLALFLVLALDYSMNNGDPKNHLSQVLSDEDKTAVNALVTEVLQAGKLQTFHQILKDYAGLG